MRRRSTSNSLAASSIDRIPLCHSRVMKFAHKSPNDFVLREYSTTWAFLVGVGVTRELGVALRFDDSLEDGAL